MSEATDPKAKQEFMTMIGHSLEIIEVDDGMLSKTNRQSIRNGILETISELMDQRDAANARAEAAEARVHELQAALDAANEDAAFHPRAAKLMRKRKNFIVIACDESYFMDVYDLIRDSEMQKGTWTIEDQWHYDDAKVAHRARVGGA